MNLLGLDGLQYDYWDDAPSLAGRDAVVVAQAGDHTKTLPELLRERFREVEEAGRVDVPTGRATVLEEPPLSFRLFRARGYRPSPTLGLKPKE